MTPIILTDFQILRPEYETSQDKILEWLAMAHAKAESLKKKGLEVNKEKENIDYQTFLNRFYHLGCKPNFIHKRGHELSDFLHQNWEEMKLFNLIDADQNANLKERIEFHMQATDKVFEKYYPIRAIAPQHMIHVSCTGYSSPSSAQKIVSKRNWGDQTYVTHAYHMGCYASIPAIRMAKAFVHQQKGNVDIVHTELCSLHFDASNHNPDQIVLQSLFGDGYIKYTICDEIPNGKPFIEILKVHEKMIPDSSEEMSWTLASFGFQGTLSKKIPALIAKHVKSFVQDISQRAGVDVNEILRSGIFAIHPGGPKILDHIQDVLELKDWQLEHSRKTLWQYGNISSATIPHIWEAVCSCATVVDGTYVISLAFGPGLNIAGTVLKKRNS